MASKKSSKAKKADKSKKADDVETSEVAVPQSVINKWRSYIGDNDDFLGMARLIKYNHRNYNELDESDQDTIENYNQDESAHISILFMMGLKNYERRLKGFKAAVEAAKLDNNSEEALIAGITSRAGKFQCHELPEGDTFIDLSAIGEELMELKIPYANVLAQYVDGKCCYYRITRGQASGKKDTTLTEALAKSKHKKWLYGKKHLILNSEGKPEKKKKGGGYKTETDYTYYLIGEDIPEDPVVEDKPATPKSSVAEPVYDESEDEPTSDAGTPKRAKH